MSFFLNSHFYQSASILIVSYLALNDLSGYLTQEDSSIIILDT